jgi:hypothetical protein
VVGTCPKGGDCSKIRDTSEEHRKRAAMAMEASQKSSGDGVKRYRKLKCDELFKQGPKTTGESRPDPKSGRRRDKTRKSLTGP